MITYILKTSSNEYYCGKTGHLLLRLKQHESESYPHWFSNIKRRNFKLIWYIIGDYEKKIKKFGNIPL